jgi:diguanylate cyclase (GGDEF)-like protein
MARRYGYLEECYFSFSYSPIRQIPGGMVVGILTASRETTRQVLGTRRLSCLRELASATAGRHTPGEVFTHAVDVLGRYPADVPYCLIMSSDPDAPQSLLPAASSGLAAAPQTTSGPAAGGLDVGGPAVGGLDAAVPELADSLDSGEIRIVDRLLERLGSHRTNATPPSTSAAAVPLTEGGDMPTIGLLVAGLSDHLPVDDDYRTFISLAATQITAAAATARAVEMERVMAADARRRALHDGLTGLPNRAALFEQLQQTIAESERARRQHVGFLFVDLDGFKSVNDTLGHHAGDELLREVAERLRQAVRPNDTVARISGDEFAVLCQNITSRKALETIAGRVINSVAIVRTTSTETIKVTASVGIAMTGPDISNPDDLVRAADTAMYAAKRRGRHCWQHFDASTPIHQPRPRS